MSFFDRFKRKETIINTNVFSEEKINHLSTETIDKIKKSTDVAYINDTMIKRMKEYPELVDLLLEGNISQEILYFLNCEIVDTLPSKKEDLKFIKFLNFDEKTKKLILLLNNIANIDVTNDNYINCCLDLSQEFETIEFHNKIESFIPNIKIDLGSELLTKINLFSNFMLYFPKLEYKFVRHNFENFINGDIELDEDTIIQMSYSSFCHLDEKVINKISKCKIIFSEKSIFKTNMQYEDKTNYKLIKYNHFIYIIEKSSLNLKIKERIIYSLKNMYILDLPDFELELSIISYLKILDMDIEEIKKLTKEFEININEYKEKSIKKAEFNASLYIDTKIPDFNSMSINAIKTIISSLDEELKILILKEPRVLKKLKLPPNLDEQSLKKICFLLSQQLDDTTIKFINSLEIDVEKFMLNPNINYQSLYDINPIISKYGVFDAINENIYISVADLLGYERNVNYDGYKGKNILYTFENFFDDNGDEYHTRALGLLEYKSGEQLVRELERRNHDTLDMCVMEVEAGKYIISSNGLHRFTVLRFHYLLDCMKKEISEEELRELYKIPVCLSSKTNLKKTYCNYLIQISNPAISCICFKRGKDEILISYKSGEQEQIINEEKLLYLTIQYVNMLDSNSLSEIMYFYYNCISFHEFIDEYIPNLLVRIENKEKVQK